MNTATAEVCKAKAFTDSVREALHYTATFIPQSQSRNAEQKEKTINWLITLGQPHRAGFMRFDYQQGICHAPGVKFKFGQKLLADAYRENAAAEFGKCYAERDTRLIVARPLPKPELVDVLSCLVVDSHALEADGFEDWAADYGYDTDSRAAKKIYSTCKKQARKLAKLINLAEAREAFQDY